MFQQQHLIRPSQVVDVRKCSRAENMHICFLFTRIILFNRHSWLKGASRVFSHEPFNAGWHDECFPLLVMVADCNSANAIDMQVSSLMKCSPSYIFSSLSFSPSTTTPCCFSAFNQFPCSISKHALWVTVRAFLALRTLLQTAHALAIVEFIPFTLKFLHAFCEVISMPINK